MNVIHLIGIIISIINSILAGVDENWFAAMGWIVAALLFTGN